MVWPAELTTSAGDLDLTLLSRRQVGLTTCLSRSVAISQARHTHFADILCRDPFRTIFRLQDAALAAIASLPAAYASTAASSSARSGTCPVAFQSVWLGVRPLRKTMSCV